MESSRDSDSPPKLSFTAGTGETKLPKRIDFYTLPRPVQDRFLASAHRTAHPLPIMFAPAKQIAPYVWIGASVAFVVAAIVLTRLGFGDWSSSIAHQRAPFVVVYAALFAAAAFGVLRAVTLLHRPKTLPFAPGIYVFPSSLIDARSHKIRVFPMRELISAERHATPVSTFHFAFTNGAKISVKVPDLDKAEKAEKALATAREALVHALEDEGPRSMAGIDPLFGGSVQSPLGPTESLTRYVPTWVRLGWTGALAVGIIVAPLVWTTRNASSDETMFVAAKNAQTIAAYKGYLAQGGPHSGEVGQILLPRAELREAEKVGTVGALTAFADSHKGSKIDAEIAASLKKAMLGELEKAKGEGTVSALKAFALKYPDNKVGPEIKAATHALYVTALENYKAKAPEKDPAIAIALVQRMLAFAEKAGAPDVEVRFHLRPSKTLALADVQAEKSKYSNGKDSQPSHYFEAARLAPREDDLAKAIVDKIASTFPADILAAKVGDRITDDTMPTFKVPTVLVEYGVEWSRTQTVSVKPKGVFVGVNLQFDVTYNVPDGQKPLKVQSTSWRMPDIYKMGDMADQPKGSREAKVYDTMSDTSFDAIARKSLGALFAMPAPPKK